MQLQVCGDFLMHMSKNSVAGVFQPDFQLPQIKLIFPSHANNRYKGQLLPIKIPRWDYWYFIVQLEVNAQDVVHKLKSFAGSYRWVSARLQ